MKKTLSLFALSLALSAWGQPLTLNQALDLAREKRLANRAASLATEGAREGAKALGAYPPFTLGVGRTTRQELGATDQDLFLALPLDVFGRSSASRRLGLARVQLAEAERRKTLIEVQTEVLSAYFEAASATRLSQVAASLLSIAESVRTATVRRFEEGKVPEVQVTRATIELDRAKQTAALRDSQVKAALKRLAGAMACETVDEVDANAEAPLPNADLDHRPDVLRHQAEHQIAEAEADIAQRSNLPELELTGLRSPWGESRTHYGARVQLTWRVFDFGRSGAERKSAQKRAHASQTVLADTRAKAAKELEALGLEVESARSRVSSYETIRVSAQDLVTKSQRGYAEGFGSLLDVLEATRSLREIEQELAEAQLALNMAIVAQYSASGSLLR